jgi:serine/threonine-protein kinase RsbW
MSRECIQLITPAKPEYILVTRLTASAIASRLDFDVDAIEDIKIAVAEAATLIMNQEKIVKELSLNFYLENDRLSIEIQGSKVEECENSSNGSDAEQKEMSMFIINSIMNDVKLYAERGYLSKIIMNKNCGSQ